MLCVECSPFRLQNSDLRFQVSSLRFRNLSYQFPTSAFMFQVFNIMRLGFHYHVPAILDGEKIHMPGYQGRFVDALAECCTEVVCMLHTPVGNECQQMDYVIRQPNVRLVDLGTP